MSLNWKEIDLILKELSLDGSIINLAIQQDFRNVFFQLYRSGEKFWFRICLESQALRIHRSHTAGRKPSGTLRFHEFLRANLQGGRIVRAMQWETNRIIQLHIIRAEKMQYCIIRLWEGKENIIITDPDYIISEVCFRRPQQGLHSGQRFTIPPSAPIEKEVRQHEGNFNEFIEKFYEDRRVHTVQQSLHKEMAQFIARQKKHLTHVLFQQKTPKDAQNYQKKGDIVLAHLHQIQAGDTALRIPDMAEISLLPELSAVDNAQRYYQRARKIRTENNRIHNRAEHIREQLKELDAAERSYLQEGDASHIQRLFKKGKKPKEATGKEFLTFSSGEYRIIVGRNAKENDLLLRKHVRGNDTWLHVRDFRGSHVFIRNHRTKSPLPREVLLDAATLALHFSKGKDSPADVYVTQVKYLRRQKHGMLGSIIPLHEKNLYIPYDKKRLQRMGIHT